MRGLLPTRLRDWRACCTPHAAKGTGIDACLGGGQAWGGRGRSCVTAWPSGKCAAPMIPRSICPTTWLTSRIQAGVGGYDGSKPRAVCSIGAAWAHVSCGSCGSCSPKLCVGDAQLYTTCALLRDPNSLMIQFPLGLLLLEHLWHPLLMLLEHVWHPLLVLLEHLCGILCSCCRNTCGILCLCCWNTCGILCSCCWNTCGILCSCCRNTCGILCSCCWNTSVASFACVAGTPVASFACAAGTPLWHPLLMLLEHLWHPLLVLQEHVWHPLLVLLEHLWHPLLMLLEHSWHPLLVSSARPCCAVQVRSTAAITRP